MNWLDYVLIALVASSVLAGLWKGLARSLIGLLAVVAGLFCGLWFYGVAGSFFYEYLSSKRLAHLLGFLVIFFGVVLTGMLVAAIAARLLKWARLSWLDHLLGGGFGLLRGTLAAAALLVAAMAFAPKPPPQAVARSRVAPYLLEAARWIVAAAPYEVREGFRESYARLKELSQEVLPGRAKEIVGQQF
ncbi:MAG: CvpA family protein [Bryobacterales bacterium]|nr:CvpA family protein [Bryobacteraceae bacterium]MDW8129047.1 CvpA family protein [Bryobacterales bacterium]